MWLVSRAFGISDANDGLSQLAGLSGGKDLRSDNLPELIWFSNIADPKTARKVSLAHIQNFFGPDARVTAANVEITRDPILVDIDKKLPWFDTLKRPLGQGLIQVGEGFTLSRHTFIGDAP